MKEKFINWLIKNLNVDTNDISDGYHTFQELYEHRCELWLNVCFCYKDRSWKSRQHSDGTLIDGYFILGLGTAKGEQITYHLPNKYWYRAHFAKTVLKAPEYDGHTSNDSLMRLQSKYL